MNRMSLVRVVSLTLLLLTSVRAVCEEGSPDVRIALNEGRASIAVPTGWKVESAKDTPPNFRHSFAAPEPDEADFFWTVGITYATSSEKSLDDFFNGVIAYIKGDPATLRFSMNQLSLPTTWKLERGSW